MEAFANARGAAYAIFSVIDTVSIFAMSVIQKHWSSEFLPELKITNFVYSILMFQNSI